MNTIVLFWRPEYTNYSVDDYQKEMEDVSIANNDNKIYSDVSLYELAVVASKRIRGGDRFFVVKQTGRNDGICMSGYLASDYYEYTDVGGVLPGYGQMDLVPDIMIHPDSSFVMPISLLQNEISILDWTTKTSVFFRRRNC